MKKQLLVLAGGLCLVAAGLSACGNDTTECLPATCGAGGDTTAGGSGGAGGDTNSGGDTGGTGGSGAAGGSVSGLETGEPCTEDPECAGGWCLAEELTGWPMGYCTAPCNDFWPCSGSDTCVSIGGGATVCLTFCEPPDGACNSAQQCYEIGEGEGVCGPGCETNDDCPILGKCMENGYCTEPEDCADGEDNDQDGLVDCEDPDCATGDCATAIDGACSGAGATQASNPGDTTNGTQLFASACNGNGAYEELWSFAPSGAGVLNLSLESQSDQGIYVRSTCNDSLSELGCIDAMWDGGVERLALPVVGGSQLTIFVDGFSGPDVAGPYTLHAEELQALTDAEPNDDYLTAQLIDPATHAFVAGHTSGDHDWLKVDVPGPNSTLTALVSNGTTDGCAPVGAIDSEIELIDTDGQTQLVINDDVNQYNYCSSATATDLPQGTYFIRASASQSFCATCQYFYSVVVEVQ